LPPLQEARVLGTLLGHTACVNCVRWLSAADLGLPRAAAVGGAGAVHPAAAALASGSGDCSVRIWLWTPHTSHQPWRLAALLEGHSSPVTSVTTFALGGGALLLVSTSGDGEVLVWECSSHSSNASNGSSGIDGLEETEEQHLQQAAWRLRQRIPVGFQLQDCAALAALPADPAWLLLALGGVDGIVRLYCCSPGGQFEAVCKLAGHQDWVRGLAFAQLDGKHRRHCRCLPHPLCCWRLRPRNGSVALHAALSPAISDA
jgi:elongator complex protein 2